MNRQHTHADWALLPQWQFPKRLNIQLRADVELASSLIKYLLDGTTLPLMLLAMLVLTFLVAIPNALATVALFQCIASLPARRTHLGWGPVFCGGFGFIVIILPFS